MLVAASSDYRERGSLVVLVVAECSKNNETASNATVLLLCRAFSANPKPLNPKPCCVFRVQTFLGVVQEAVSKH